MEFILIKFVFNESYTLLQQVSYLSRFGYLPSSEQLEGALITEAQVRDAVKNLQVRDSPNFFVLLPPKTEHFFPVLCRPGFHRRRGPHHCLPPHPAAVRGAGRHTLWSE